MNLVLAAAVLWLAGRAPEGTAAAPARTEPPPGLSAKIDALLAENADLRARLEAVKTPSAAIDVPAEQRPKRHYDSAPAVPKEKVETARRSFNDWFLDRKIADLEKFAALSDSEKGLLKEKFLALSEDRRERMKSGGEVPDPEVEEAAIYEEVLGHERAAALAQSRASREVQAEREVFEQTVFTFSRKLALTPEQEAMAADALRQVDTETQQAKELFNARMRTISAQHGTSSPEAMRAAFDELQKMRRDSVEARSRLIQEKFKPFLSEDQYNRLLEEAAKTEGTFGVDSF